MKAYDTSPAWSSWEICLAIAEGDWKRPVSEALASGRGDEIETAIGDMKALGNLGWPAARQGSLKISRADQKMPKIWILKCKPSCWRIYFYALDYKQNDKRILYLHAICKKTNDQDPANAKRARRLYDAFVAEQARIARFAFPSH